MRVEVALVPAREDDSDFVYEASREAMRSYVAQVWGRWDEGEQLAFHRAGFNPEAGWFLIEVGGERVGVVQYQADDDELWLGRITILPRHQGQGVGTSRNLR